MSKPTPNKVTNPLSPAARFAETLRMMSFGFSQWRHKLKREHPEATESEIDALILAIRLIKTGSGPWRQVVSPQLRAAMEICESR